MVIIIKLYKQKKKMIVRAKNQCGKSLHRPLVLNTDVELLPDGFKIVAGW